MNVGQYKNDGAMFKNIITQKVLSNFETNLTMTNKHLTIVGWFSNITIDLDIKLYHSCLHLIIISGLLVY